jgi:DNA polymerase-3 subunit epsilon
MVAERKGNWFMQIISPPSEADHQIAVEWARGVLADPFTRILDTETTDLDGWVCEFSMINNQGGTLFDTVLNPLAPISDEAYKVHGISNDEAYMAPTFKKSIALSDTMFHWGRTICWNAPFDYKMVSKELKRAGRLSIPDNWECAMRMYGQWKGELNQYGTYKWYKLEGGHRALGDCLAVLERLNEMAQG